MAHVHLWKLGNYYSGKEDRNGGNAEYNYIKKELESICKSMKVKFHENEMPTKDELNEKIIVFVVNGLMQHGDIQRAEEYREYADEMVYFLTDFGFADQNRAVVKVCDLVLHQSPHDQGFRLFNKPGFYSFVPEIFYDESIPKSDIKMDLCFFGGNQAGREEEFSEYIVDESGYPAMRIKNGIASFFKTADGKDFRVSYENYRRILSLFRFAFVSGRNAGKEVGWVTPRIVEAVNAGCIPILINDYDSTNYFGLKDYRVHSYKDLFQFMEEANEADERYLETVVKRIKAGKHLFRIQIERIIKRPLQENKNNV